MLKSKENKCLDYWNIVFEFTPTIMLEPENLQVLIVSISDFEWKGLEL